MHREGSAVNLIPIANAVTAAGATHLSAAFKRKRLLDVSDVAEWLGVSKGWVRDHASGRRQPRLLALKLGPFKGKGLWKFREEDVDQFIHEQRGR